SETFYSRNAAHLALLALNFSLQPLSFSLPNPSPFRLNSPKMALVRILVDGYSLLHNWPQLAPGKARHSAEARDELIHILTLYRDASGTPLTIVFDGAGPRGPRREKTDPNEVEV